MKTAFREGLAIGLLALILFLCTPAYSETGSTLLQACEALEREARLSGDNIWLPNRTDVHKCWGYMGLSQSASSVDGQPSLLVRHRSSAERRWVEAHGASALGSFVDRRYSDCGVDRCRNVFPVGQPKMKRR
jgi:hypothetical protein